MPHGRAARRLAATGTAAIALVAAACSGGDEATPEPTVAPTTTEAPEPRVSDGVLRIGALVPGNDTRVGAALTDAIESAARAVNAAGGVLDDDIEVTIIDEGGTSATASAAIAELLDDDVDAIIGPSSSITTLGAVSDAITAGIVTCSPTATAIALDDFPDDDNLFFRTIASDSLQSLAIAELAEDTGESSVAIVHLDDAYGRPYAAAVSDALEALQLQVVTTVPIGPGDDDLDDDMAELVESGARVAVVLAAPSDAARFLDAISRQRFLVFSDVIVNDAVRDPVARPVIVGLPTSLRNRITVVAPQISTRDGDFVAGPPFEPQATDCLNILALAAVRADSDMPSDIAQQIPSVSSGGSVCSSFSACAEELALSQEIDYRGPTGITEINREGETSLARFETFRFADDGSDQFVSTLTIGL